MPNTIQAASSTGEGWTTRGRRAALLVAAGMGVQLAASLHWTPATFILSTAIGLPLVAVGVVLFARVVWHLGRGGER